MKISNNSRKIISNTAKLPKRFALNMREATVNSAKRMRTDILLSMKKTPKTGRSYKKGKTAFHQASSPGFPPAIDETGLSESIIIDERKNEVEVGSEKKIADYGGWLEEGTKHIKPRPFLEPAMRREENTFKKDIDKRIKRKLKGLDK